MTSTRRTFSITLAGEVGPPTRAAFADVEVHVGDGTTVLSGEFVDQAALHGLLERVQSLGLVLVDVHVQG